MKGPRAFITRMNYVTRRKNGTWKRTRGWWVRFQRTDIDGIRRTTGRFFADRKHGGKLAALALAFKARAELEESVPANKHKAPVGHSVLRRTRKRGKWVWEAWVYVGEEARQLVRKQASVELLGEAGAKRACQAWVKAKRAELNV